jgi:hypothetical protein
MPLRRLSFELAPLQLVTRSEAIRAARQISAAACATKWRAGIALIVGYPNRSSASANNATPTEGSLLQHAELFVCRNPQPPVSCPTDLS